MLKIPNRFEQKAQISYCKDPNSRRISALCRRFTSSADGQDVAALYCLHTFLLWELKLTKHVYLRRKEKLFRTKFYWSLFAEFILARRGTVAKRKNRKCHLLPVPFLQGPARYICNVICRSSILSVFIWNCHIIFVLNVLLLCQCYGTVSALNTFDELWGCVGAVSTDSQGNLRSL